jgi:hypothetical protein
MSVPKSKILLPLDSLMLKIQCLLLFFSRFEELSPVEGYHHDLTVSKVRVLVTLCNTLPLNHFTLCTYTPARELEMHCSVLHFSTAESQFLYHILDGLSRLVVFLILHVILLRK